MYTWRWDVKMPSKIITVRFDKQLYNKVKNHYMNTSDLIRTSVVNYLKYLEKMENENIQPVPQQTPVLHDYYTEQTVIAKKPSDRKSITTTYSSKNNLDEISNSIDELKKKFEELDEEIDNWSNTIK